MLNTLSLRELVERPGRLLLRVHSALEHLSGAVPADLQFHSLPDRRIRRNQSRAVRSARSGKRTGRRIPHRIQQHEVRVVLHGRIRQHGDGLLRRDAPVPGRMAAAVPGGIWLELHPDADFRAAAPCSASITASIRRGRSTASRCRCSASFFWASRGYSWSHPVQFILLPLFWFCAKVGIILFVFIWIRGTLPRFRYDQLMRFAWTFMFPVAIVNLFVTASWWLSIPDYGRDPVPHLRRDRRGLRHQPGAADASDFERAVADRRDGRAGRAVPAAGRRIHRRRRS